MKKSFLSLALVLFVALALAPVALAEGTTASNTDIELTNVLRERTVQVIDEDGEETGLYQIEWIVAEGATLTYKEARWSYTLMRSFVNPSVNADGELEFEWSGDWEEIEVIAEESIFLETNAVYTVFLWGEVYVVDSATAAKFTDGSSPAPATPAPATPAPSGETANPTASTVYVDGTAKAFEAYNIDGNNYFKLRDLAAVLSGTEKQFEVGYNNDTKAITLTSGQAYTSVGGELAAGDGTAKTATPTASKIYLDGTELSLTVYTINDNNFFKLRDLMQAIDVFVGYDNETKNITLDTSNGYIVE